MSRFARKRDANERAIIEVLRAAGASVEQLDGSGVPDLLVAYGSRLFLLEVKETRTASTGKGWKRSESRYPELTPAQVRWWSAWTGKAETMPVIVYTPTQALCAVGRHARIREDWPCGACGATP